MSGTRCFRGRESKIVSNDNRNRGWTSLSCTLRGSFVAVLETENERTNAVEFQSRQRNYFRTGLLRTLTGIRMIIGRLAIIKLGERIWRISQRTIVFVRRWPQLHSRVIGCHSFLIAPHHGDKLKRRTTCADANATGTTSICAFIPPYYVTLFIPRCHVRHMPHRL